MLYVGCGRAPYQHPWHTDLLCFLGYPCSLSALSVRDSLSASRPLMSQSLDVYSSAKLLAVLIILAQAAAGDIGWFSGQPSSPADGYGARHGEGLHTLSSHIDLTDCVCVCEAYPGASTLHAVFIRT